MATEHEPDECRATRAEEAAPDRLSCLLRVTDVGYVLGHAQSGLYRRLARLSERSETSADRPEEIDEMLAAWQLLHAFPFDDPSPLSA